MAGKTPELLEISPQEWDERFDQLAKQTAEREIFAVAWWHSTLYVSSTVCRLWADELAIHLELSATKRRDGFCAEIALMKVPESTGEYGLCETAKGEIYLVM